MCGIAGVYNSHIDQGLFRNCLDRMSYRGPDDCGIWHDNMCMLGHRRLSIIDISEKGHQPMASNDGRYILTYNGEIYNYVELRRELKSCGYKFLGNSDSEVVLYAFIEWREKCLAKFNGMWAFAIYDTKEKKLFLARDRFGVKPLFYTTVQNGLTFASEMKALIPMLEHVTPNEGLVGRKSKILCYESTEKTLINEIKRLPAGYYAWAIGDSFVMNKWWDTLSSLIEVPSDYDSQVEMFRELFLDACRLRMRSDVPIGTALSGGLDSSSTICSMNEIVKKNDYSSDKDYRHAFAAVFPSTKLDESYYSDVVADYIGIPYEKVIIDPQKAINDMERDIYRFEEIYYTCPSPMIQLYAALRKGNVLVTLDGHGADELFGGYENDILYALPDTDDASETALVMDTWYQAFPDGWIHGSASAVKNKVRFRFMLEYYAKKILNIPGHGGYKGNCERDDFYRLDSLERCLYNQTHLETLPTLLRNYDHYSMANGVEIRMPFLDHRIVSFAFSIGWRSKLHEYYTKSIIRDAMRGIVPEEVLTRRTKIGFNAPVVEWVKGPWREWITDTVRSSDFLNCSLIDSGKVIGDLRKVIESNRYEWDLGIDIWVAINTYLWEKVLLRNNIQ